MGITLQPLRSRTDSRNSAQLYRQRLVFSAICNYYSTIFPYFRRLALLIYHKTPRYPYHSMKMYMDVQFGCALMACANAPFPQTFPIMRMPQRSDIHCSVQATSRQKPPPLSLQRPTDTYQMTQQALVQRFFGAWKPHGTIARCGPTCVVASFDDRAVEDRGGMVQTGFPIFENTHFLGF